MDHLGDRHKTQRQKINFIFRISLTCSHKDESALAARQTTRSSKTHTQDISLKFGEDDGNIINLLHHHNVFMMS